MAYAALLLASIVTHSRIEGVVDPAQLLFGSAATIVVWTSTIAILTCSNRAFVVCQAPRCAARRAITDPPTLTSMPSATHGKICYVELPAVDVERSATFYADVLGWRVRQRGDGQRAFDDATGQVSGTWVTGRAAAAPGLLLYVMVDSVADVLALAVAHGAEVVQPIGADAPEITARFRDPGGNVVGLYQEPAPADDGGPMSTAAARPVTIACSLAPMLSVRQGARAVAFYVAALGAIEVFRVEDPSGAVVSRLSVRGAEFWVSDESPEDANFSPESLGGGSVRMILTAPDPDAMIAQAIAAGAREIVAVGEAYGWRLGRIVDPFGHHWEIGHPL